MPDVVSIPLAATALAVSSQAMQAADEARRTACVTLLHGFSDAAASVAQKQAYASCINLLYPAAVSAIDWPWPVLFGLALVPIGMIVGATIGWKEDGFVGGVLLAFVGGGMVFLI